MKKIKIVLIDDHLLFLEGLKALLSQHNHIEIIAAFTNPIKALNSIKHLDYDLLITDISMPEMSGIELISNIRKENHTSKILIISSYNQNISIKKIDGYITKTYASKKLITTINSIVFQNKMCFTFDIFTKMKCLEFKRHILTKKEKEILKLVALGKTIYEISEQLFISKHTVESHKKNIYKKLKVNNVVDLIKVGMFLGLFVP